MRELTHLSLFTGIGGLDLAAEWAGFHTVGQCEWADYPTKILEKHWPDVPRWRDIRTLTGENYYERTGRRSIDVISGGFPCQPFSTAGKRRGKEDDRYLWPEMVRVIKELRPTWVVGENVAGIVSMALDAVLSDLEAEGYATRAFLIPAAGVEAPHMRYRTAIVAHADSRGQLHGWHEVYAAEGRQPAQFEFVGCGKTMAHTKGSAERGLRIRTQEEKSGFGGSREDVADTTGTEDGRAQQSEILANLGTSSKGRSVCHTAGKRLSDRTKRQMEEQKKKQESKRPDWWETEPAVGRVANGIPNRVDRLKCLGNAVVPQQFYPIFQGIADIESNR